MLLKQFVWLVINILSGADLANLINQAALKASADGKTEVTESDMEYARDKILMGKVMMSHDVV